MKITKTICDKCNRELDYEEEHYDATIIAETKPTEKGRQIANGDFCKKCFKELIEKEIENTWQMYFNVL